MKNIVLLLVVTPLLSYGQLAQQDSVWLPFGWMIGQWTGTSEGQPGTGVYARTYELVLNKKFIEVRNTSTYPPTQSNPKGEVHEDRGYLSYDRLHKTFRLRQFHIEGFVNEYRLESISPDGKTLVFLSESIENIPPGFRAKETYRLINEHEFTETFELAEPGKEFQVYSKATLKRKR